MGTGQQQTRISGNYTMEFGEVGEILKIFQDRKIYPDCFDLMRVDDVFADEVCNFMREKYVERCAKKQISMTRAIKFLGKEKVITMGQSAKIYDIKISQRVPIRYSEATIKRCSEENKKGKADWRLIFINGLSMQEQRQKWGVNSDDYMNCPDPKDPRPCFDKDNTWWLDEKESNWANFKPETGYYLLNFKPYFSCMDMDWQRQESEIKKMGLQFQRCLVAVFSEAVFTSCKVNSEEIARHWKHWSDTVSSNIHICVGFFHNKVWMVSNCYSDNTWSVPGLCVCLSLKWES